MLYYEDGYVCDTSDGTRQLISEQELSNAQSLGIKILGVDGADWRAINRSKLKALNGVSVSVDSLGLLNELNVPIFTTIELSGVAKGFRNFPRLNGNFNLVLDNTLNYHYFRWATGSSKNTNFDLCALSGYNLGIVFLSFASRLSIADFSRVGFLGRDINKIKVRHSDKYPLILLALLFRFNNNLTENKRLVSEAIKENYLGYKDDLLPYLMEFVTYLNSVPVTNVLPEKKVFWKSVLDSLSATKSVSKRLKILLEDSISDMDCEVCLNVIRGYISIFGKLPGDIEFGLNIFIDKIIACRGC